MSNIEEWNREATRLSGTNATGIEVSANDKREWAHTTLPNGLVVVTISDPECVVASIVRDAMGC